MAIYHCQIKNIGRSSGRSAVACSAYRSASEMQDEELGKKFDYTKKQGVEYSNVILCANAPREYADREILWNEVHKVEKAKDARLAREFEVALPNELTPEQAQELTDRFAKSLADEGMCVDYSIHNPQKKDKNQNRHAHIMATTRQITEKGEWDTKYKKVYANDRDEQGKPIYNPDKPNDKEHRIPQLNPDGTQKVRVRQGKGEEKLWERVNAQYNPWDRKEKVEEWRERWANMTNEALEKAQSEERVTHLSFEKQGKEELPTIHEGYSTVKKEINQEIRAYNEELHHLQESEKLYGRMKDYLTEKLDAERKEQENERLGENSERLENDRRGLEETGRETSRYDGEAEYYSAKAEHDYRENERDRQTAGAVHVEAERSIERSRASEGVSRAESGRTAETERYVAECSDRRTGAKQDFDGKFRELRNRVTRAYNQTLQELRSKFDSIREKIESLKAKPQEQTFERRMENLQSRTDQIRRNQEQAKADKELQEQREKTREKSAWEEKLEKAAQRNEQSRTEGEAAKAPEQEVPAWQRKFESAYQTATENREQPIESNREYKRAYEIAREGLEAQTDWMRKHGMELWGNEPESIKFDGDYKKAFEKCKEIFDNQHDILYRENKSTQSYTELASGERGEQYLRLNKTVFPRNRANVQPLGAEGETQSQHIKRGYHR